MRQTARTVGIAFALGLIAAVAMAQVATASLYLALTPSGGPSGIVVRGETIGSGAGPLARNKRLPLYLIPNAAANDVHDSSDNRLIRVGELVVNDVGDGSTSFTIPAVSPGPYAVMVYCEPCAPASAGSTMLLVGELRVAPTVPSTGGDTSWRGILAEFLLAAAAAATLVVVTRRLSGRRR